MTLPSGMRSCRRRGGRRDPGDGRFAAHRSWHRPTWSRSSTCWPRAGHRRSPLGLERHMPVGAAAARPLASKTHAVADVHDVPAGAGRAAGRDRHRLGAGEGDLVEGPIERAPDRCSLGRDGGAAAGSVAGAWTGLGSVATSASECGGTPGRLPGWAATRLGRGSVVRGHPAGRALLAERGDALLALLAGEEPGRELEQVVELAASGGRARSSRLVSARAAGAPAASAASWAAHARRPPRRRRRPGRPARLRPRSRRRTPRR